MVIDRLTPRRKSLARVEVRLRMAGPAVRYEVGLDLEADGNRFDVSTPKPAIRPSMGCDDEEMSWGFEIPDDALDRVWVIASWMEARGTDLRMAALAWNLITPEIYEWKWAADWFVSRAGHWRKRRSVRRRHAPFPDWAPWNWAGHPAAGVCLPPNPMTARQRRSKVDAQAVKSCSGRGRGCRSAQGWGCRSTNWSSRRHPGSTRWRLLPRTCWLCPGSARCSFL